MACGARWARLLAMSFPATSKKLCRDDAGTRRGFVMTAYRRVVQPVTVIAVVMALSFGCQKSDNRPRRVPVSGIVLYKGQPVADATVLFGPVGSTPAATGTTDASGRYQLTTFD